MKIKLLESDRSDITDFVENLLAEINVDDFPAPDILAEAVALTTSLYDSDRTRACQFLATPNINLDNQKPIELLKEQDGLDQLSALLRRINEGFCA